MIRGLHGLFYTSEPEAMRAFLRDKMQLPWTDVGEGWLIFDLPQADVGVHPTEESGGTPSGTHDVSFYCDDIDGTVAGLKARGVQFRGEIEDRGYGRVTYFTMPGGVEVQLYEPRYRKRTPQAHASADRPRVNRKAREVTRSAAGKKVGRGARKGGQVKKLRR
jgi:predicted enzyme related to lactoylglutathione lyase